MKLINKIDTNNKNIGIKIHQDRFGNDEGIQFYGKKGKVFNCKIDFVRLFHGNPLPKATLSGIVSSTNSIIQVGGTGRNWIANVLSAQEMIGDTDLRGGSLLKPLDSMVDTFLLPNSEGWHGVKYKGERAYIHFIVLAKNGKINRYTKGFVNPGWNIDQYHPDHQETFELRFAESELR